MINPYNFVRAGNPQPRGEPNGHEKLRGRSGTITCQLEVVTPIFTPAVAFRPQGGMADLTFFRINRQPALPGASLKGMFRGLAEAICNGCSPFSNPSHPPCQSLQNLCPACRVFGYLKGENVHAGHLHFSDAIVEEGYGFGSPMTLKELSSPKTRHVSFYGQARRDHGRKFYYHQSQHIGTTASIPTESRPTHRNVRIEPLVQGVFHFTVRYWNISEIDLGLLVHTVDLPDGLYQKFGMGKPLGLGTVRIRIIGWKDDNPTPADPASRYESFELETLDISTHNLQGDALTQAQRHLSKLSESLKVSYAREVAQTLHHQEQSENLWELPANNIQDLRIMLSLVPYGTEILYPGYNWFHTYPADALPTVQDTHQGARLIDA